MSVFVRCLLGEALLDGGSVGFVAGLFEQGEHVALVGFYAGLVEGVDAEEIAADAHCFLEEIDELSE